MAAPSLFSSARPSADCGSGSRTPEARITAAPPAALGPRSLRYLSAYKTIGTWPPVAAPRARASRRRRRAPQPAPRSTETRLRIIEAALHAFGDRGFDGALTRDIAAAAGVQQPLINYHFGSKDGLWRPSSRTSSRELREPASRRRCRGCHRSIRATPLAAVLRHFVLFNAEHPELARLMIKEAAARGPRLEWIVEPPRPAVVRSGRCR